MAKTKTAATEKKERKTRTPATFIVLFAGGDYVVCEGKEALTTAIGNIGKGIVEFVYRAKPVEVRYETRVRFGAARAKKGSVESVESKGI